jgi:hypothetical protein
MSKKSDDRPYMGMGVFQPDGDAAPGTTIVGGQPDGQPRRGTQSVPVGLEQVLYTAAMEPAFKTELLADREAAVERRGFALTASERSMLRVAPPEQLGQMIDRIDTSAASLERRDFLRAVAATMVTIAAGSELAACGSTDGNGSGTETGAPFKGPVEGQQQQDQTSVEMLQDPSPPPTGIRPDLEEPPRDAGPAAQPPTIEVEPEVRPTKGIRPDPPEPKQPTIEHKPPKALTRGSRPR